jgi:multisubunit Na+/H+ antiporter MnhG subunit
VNEPTPDSPAVKANARLLRVRRVLAVGSLVFGLSALTLILFPAFFNSLLGLQTSAALEWAMRMIGITLVALAGNMFSVAAGGLRAQFGCRDW